MSTLKIRERLITIASGKVGVRESPLGSNSGPEIVKFQRASNLDGSGWPWCAAFIDWCVIQWGKYPDVLAALKLSAAQFEDWRPKTALAYGFEQWGRDKGLLVHNENRNPNGLVLHTGDIVTYDKSHCGIIYDDSGSKIFTIEGNTNDRGDSNGDGVYLMERKRSFIRSVIRPLA